MLLYLSTIAGLATTLGCLVVLFMGIPTEKMLAFLLAGAGGVMLAVVTFDLAPAALSYKMPSQFISGFIIGIIFIYVTEKILKLRYRNVQVNRKNRLKRVGILIASGIALHDIPEGMAIAISQESTGHLGIIIAVGIALHNLPEGMATAAPLLMAGIRRRKILFLNFAIALFTPMGALLGKLLMNATNNLLCFFLSLAAGAMTYLVLSELWPLSREQNPGWALFGGTAGYIFFVLLTLLL